MPKGTRSMQKLVTIYLDNSAYSADKWVTTSYADKHGLIEEHLQDHLSDGWAVSSLASFGGSSSDGFTARGWVVVLLEKK